MSAPPQRPYDKRPTTIDDQLARLAEKGMRWSDEDAVRRWLTSVGYYRLGAYWYWYRDDAPAAAGPYRYKPLRPDTTFEKVVSDYTFDRDLRLLVMEGIERIETDVRSWWARELALAHDDAHVHLDPTAFRSAKEHAEQIARAAKEFERSSDNEHFAKHYKRTYSAPDLPPIWVATELMTFGSLTKWVEMTGEAAVLKTVAKGVGLPAPDVLVTVLQVLNEVRNVCAHHGRLWNRRLVRKFPKIKKFASDLRIEGQTPDARIYNVLVVMAWMLRAEAGDTSWPSRAANLMTDKRTLGELETMGFPADWRTRPVWR